MTEIFGYAVCPCGKPVLNEVAYKTRGRCSDCFRAKLNPVFDEIIAVTKDRERILLKLDRRTPGERAQRRRAKARTRAKQREQHRVTMLARTRAMSRLAKTFPAVFEFYLADERAKLGLEAWTVDRALTEHRLDDRTMELLRAYASLEPES